MPARPAAQEGHHDPSAPHITAFLRQRLPVERAASPHTCDTYAYAFQLLFAFACRKLSIVPSALQLEHLDAPCFSSSSRTCRPCEATAPAPATRGSPLTAIKSFMHFVEHRVPGALEQIQRVLALPSQKTDRRLVDHLTAEECQHLLDARDPTTRAGIRDRTMLHVSVTAGLRVSELVGLRLDDVAFSSRYADLRVRGKGRKERILTLWKVVADSVRAWLGVRGEARVPELFLNARGCEMTRAGFAHLLRQHAVTARAKSPALRAKRISPHVLRHTCALNVLQANR